MLTILEVIIFMKYKEGVGRNIKILSNHFRRRSQEFEKCGANGHILFYLYKNHKSDIYQKDIEDAFSIRRSTATGVLQRMEKNGLIVRSPCNFDARLKTIGLTDKALAILQRIDKSIEETETIVRKNISQNDLEVFFKVIKKMIKNMEEHYD